MQNLIIVAFGKEKEFEFKLAKTDVACVGLDDARSWFEREFEALECDVATPTGKILAVDRILSVAKYAGEARFAAADSWTQQFVRYTAVILGRELIRVDVEHYSIGYWSVNKAFVRESEGDEEEELDASLKLPAGTRNYITPAGHARLKSELEHLVKRERPHVVEIVAWAASNGDRSENGDYIYGKRRLREIDRRIRFLTKRLDIAEVVDPLRQGDNDQVFFGATVTVADEAGVENTYSIVGVDETDVAAGRISWISPLARALIKAREGDSVRFQSPLGVREFDIVQVVYQTIPQPEK